MTCHIIHRAVASGGEPFDETRFLLRQVDAADADFLESELASPTHDIANERVPVAMPRSDKVGGLHLAHDCKAYIKRAVALTAHVPSTGEIHLPDAAATEAAGARLARAL